MYDFYKWVIFENEDIVDIYKVNFCISKLFIQVTYKCYIYVIGVANIYLHVSLLIPVCPVYVFSVCMIPNQGISKNHVIFVKSSVKSGGGGSKKIWKGER